MGSVLAEAMEDIKEPRVGLLNIGHESTKGNVLVKQTHDLLKETSLNYIGFVEGDDIFIGLSLFDQTRIDDGFVSSNQTIPEPRSLCLGLLLYLDRFCFLPDLSVA